MKSTNVTKELPLTRPANLNNVLSDADIRSTSVLDRDLELHSFVLPREIAGNDSELGRKRSVSCEVRARDDGSFPGLVRRVDHLVADNVVPQVFNKDLKVSFKKMRHPYYILKLYLLRWPKVELFRPEIVKSRSRLLNPDDEAAFRGLCAVFRQLQVVGNLESRNAVPTETCGH